MSANTPIRSKQNPLIKRIGAVRAGLEEGLLVLEGDRLIDDAIAARIELDVVLVGDDCAERAADLDRRGQRVQLVERELMDRVSGLKSGPGILALCRTPASIDIERIPLDRDARVLVAAGIADPVNIGALARSCEAFGVRALLVARGSASPWNERALRGSMGSVLRVAIGFGLDAQAIASALAARNVRQITAATRGGRDARAFDWTGPIALWMSAETGAMPIAAQRFDAVTIPMASGVESLNVAVAGSILLYASARSDTRERKDAPRV